MPAPSMDKRLGPFPASDSPLMRRVRIHQAWYRLEVLGLEEYGLLATTGTPCGSVLPVEAARRGLNFESSAAKAAYQERRGNGWGVDPVRCTAYMTSSQTLTFNMFADLVLRPVECAQLMNHLLARSDLKELAGAYFEYSARTSPYGLGDKTLIDLLLRFKRRNGGEAVVAVETKLADRFSTRVTKASGSGGYAALSDMKPVWIDLEAALKDPNTRQLARCHALATSVQYGLEPTAARPASSLVILLSGDSVNQAKIQKYEKMVSDKSLVRWVEWPDYIDGLAAVGIASADRLRKRYTDLRMSDHCVHGSTEATTRLRGGSEGDVPCH